MALASLLRIPDARRFLQDSSVYLALLARASVYGVLDDRGEELLDATDAVLEGTVAVADLPALFAEAFALAPDRAQELARDVVGVRLLPLAEFLPGVREQFLAWGGDEQAYGGRVVTKRPLSSLALAEDIAQACDIVFSELLLKRLAFLLAQRFLGEKDDEQLRTFLGRSLALGGLALEKDAIDAVMAKVGDMLPLVKIVEEQDVVETQPKDVVETQFIASQDKNNEQDIVETPSKDAETQFIASQEKPESKPEPKIIPKVPEKPLHDEVPSAEDALRAQGVKRQQDSAIAQAFTEAVDVALAHAQATLEEQRISSALFADAVGKTLRGIRTLAQTRDALERDAHVRGEVLVKLVAAVQVAEEAYRVAVDALHAAHVATEISERDAEALLEQESTLFSATHPPVQPGVVELTVGSIPPSDVLLQRKVTDVVPGKMLMDPAEQLGALTLADFRRMSPQPEEAVKKMEALLQGLERVSYEDRVRGVLAWRKSPLAHLYGELLQSSLANGTSLAEVTARYRAQGKETLTPAELQALAVWNTLVRF